MNPNSALSSNKSNLGYFGKPFAEAMAVPLEYYNNFNRENKLEPDWIYLPIRKITKLFCFSG